MYIYIYISYIIYSTKAGILLRCSNQLSYLAMSSTNTQLMSTLNSHSNFISLFSVNILYGPFLKYIYTFQYTTHYTHTYIYMYIYIYILYIYIHYIYTYIYIYISNILHTHYTYNNLICFITKVLHIIHKQ